MSLRHTTADENKPVAVSKYAATEELVAERSPA